MVAEAMELSRELCMALWSPPEELRIIDEVGNEAEIQWQKVCKAARVLKKRGLRSLLKDWNDTNEIVLQHLVLWRDRNARLFDENPAYIAATGHLLNYAKYLPLTVKELMLVVSPLPAFLVEDNSRLLELLDCIAKAKQLAIEEINRTVEEETKKIMPSDTDSNKKVPANPDKGRKYSYIGFLNNNRTVFWVVTLSVATVFIYNIISFRRRK